MCTSLQLENRECMARDNLCVRITTISEYEMAAAYLGIGMDENHILPFLLVPRPGDGRIIISADQIPDNDMTTYEDNTVLSADAFKAYFNN